MSRKINKQRSTEIVNLCETIFADKIPTESIKYSDCILKDMLPYRNQETKLEIINTSSIAAALKEKRYNPNSRVAVLNMANATRPGGGWDKGAFAQEEELFRSTNLYKTLKYKLYPMKKTEIIHSPIVHVLRNENYDILEKPVTVGFISAAAVCKPVTQNGHLNSSHHQEMVTKIRMVFHLAAINEYDCLVLSALGCGAFRNPPHDIANIFADVINEYSHNFKRIVFAIKCKSDNPNYNIFCDVFKDKFNVDQ